MRILPVIDLKQGVVVRGVGGRRAEYRPISSRLTPSCAPADVARAFREKLGLNELYLADLDAIAGAPPALATYAAIESEGSRLWVDAGVRDCDDALRLMDAGIKRVVVALETLQGPEALNRICQQCAAKHLVFSLDLRDGQPLSEWEDATPDKIAGHATALGISRIIVLDLAHVGTGRGTGTLSLCRRFHAAFPDVEIIAGGGVRGLADLHQLKECGVSWALVASALHDGILGRADVERL